MLTLSHGLSVHRFQPCSPTFPPFHPTIIFPTTTKATIRALTYPDLPISETSKTLTVTLDQKLVVAGGNILSGNVPISGSKNSALPILAGTLCCAGVSKLHNVPDLLDTRTLASILRSLGAKVEFSGNEMVVDAEEIGSVRPCTDSVGRIRAGFFVLGPLLARFGEAEVALPGGCDIGARPVDLFLRGLRALGAVVELS